jgi:probable HAF family extracellular repeat protein
VAGNYLRDDPEEEPYAWHAFRWEGGAAIDLGTLPGFTRYRVLGMNDVGQIVGQASEPNVRPFLWQNGVMRNLNELADDPPRVLVGAWAINDAGQILVDSPGTIVVLTPLDRPRTDLDIDCRTDWVDLCLLLEDWGRGDSPADLDGDGVVGFEDLVILLAHWG